MGHRGHQQTQAPAVEPVTLASLKAHLIIDFNGEDELLRLYLASARETIEQFSALALIDQAWALTLDAWPGRPCSGPWWEGSQDGPLASLQPAPGAVTLPRYPLKSVSAVLVDGEPADIGAFTVDTQQTPGRLALKSGATWPPALQSAAGIRIEYAAGFGAEPATVPAALRLAVMQFAAFLYTNRGDDCSQAEAYEASGAAALVESYRARGL